MKKIYLLTIISLLIISCEKESGPTFINGSVKDKTTNAGIANADVGLFETDGESAFGLGGVLIDEIYSDAAGKFTFDFEARNGYSYYVQAIKDQYWNNQTDNITFVDDTGGETDVIVYLHPEGWLKLTIRDTMPFTINTEFRMTPFNGSFWVSATELDTILTGVIFGNQYKPLYWVLEDFTTSGIETYTDSIYCPAFDTTYYEILY